MFQDLLKKFKWWNRQCNKLCFCDNIWKDNVCTALTFSVDFICWQWSRNIANRTIFVKWSYNYLEIFKILHCFYEIWLSANTTFHLNHHPILKIILNTTVSVMCIACLSTLLLVNHVHIYIYYYIISAIPMNVTKATTKFLHVSWHCIPNKIMSISEYCASL